MLLSFIADASHGEQLEHLLFRAIKERDDGRVVQLVREGTPVTVRFADGTTPHMIPSLHGNCEIMRLL